MVDFATSSDAGRYSSASLPSARIRIISSRSGLPRAKSDIFEANLFTFGVIGDHNIPVSAAAQLREQQPVSAAGR